MSEVPTVTLGDGNGSGRTGLYPASINLWQAESATAFLVAAVEGA